MTKVKELEEKLEGICKLLKKYQEGAKYDEVFQTFDLSLTSQKSKTPFEISTSRYLNSLTY
jgi:hypothetical protein